MRHSDVYRFLVQRKSHLAPYAIFLAFAAGYFWYYLPQGFSLFDDGYLLGVAHRLVTGESLYTDFYFFRTPLSVYIQSALISVFSDWHTVLWSKVYWASQLTATTVIASLIYRRWLTPAALTLTLLATLVYSSLMFSFPWYSYDGLFFAVIYAYLFWRRSFVMAGAAAGLAFLCKQSFLALAPLTILGWLLLVMSGKETLRSWAQMAGRVAAGWTLVVGGLVIYLSLNGALEDFWRNVVILPERVNPLSRSFLVWQNLPAVLVDNWQITVLFALAMLIRMRNWMAIFLLFLLGIFYREELGYGRYGLQYLITPLAYLVTFVSAIRFALRKTLDPSQMVFLTLAAVVLYAASLNYGGLKFSYIAGPLVVPALALALSRGVHLGVELRLTAHGARDSLKPETKTTFGIAFLLMLLVFSLQAHHTFPYKEPARSELVTAFQTDLLRGIRSSGDQTHYIDSVVSYVAQHTGAEDRIFAFPDFTSLNYLSGRRAWGNTHWHYELEFDELIAQETVERLRTDPPELALLRTHGRIKDPDIAPFTYIQSDKSQMIVDALLANMSTVDSIGPFYILRPGGAGGGYSTPDSQDYE